MLIDDHHSACIGSWYPPDRKDVVNWCHIPNDEVIAFEYHIVNILVALINIVNISFGVIFTLKLREFVRMNRGNSTPRAGVSVKSKSEKRMNFKVEALIVKSNILVVAGIIATTLSYAVYAVMNSTNALTVGIYVNCLTIGLMFQVNQRWYNKLCRPCIMLCFRKCDPYSDEQRVIRMIARDTMSTTSMSGTSTNPLPVPKELEVNVQSVSAHSPTVSSGEVNVELPTTPQTVTTPVSLESPPSTSNSKAMENGECVD